ncbi:MAG TPA: DUF1572 family protein [Candidatus Saccharimonadales bacterium]|jgi:hypothetical protein|nr:DUF1572 family protein [Candidatus Saccharimonadales bacterium]
MAEDHTIAAAYLDEARRSFNGYKRLAEGAFAQLQDADFFYTPGPESNSVALLVKHMSGNMRSRFTDFLTTDGEKPNRHRDREFEMEAAVTREQVLRWWEDGWNCVFQALKALKPADLTRTVYIRGEALSVLQALNRQVTHYAQHSGQILFLAKMVRKSEWKSLSIPRGKSAEVNARAAEGRGPGPTAAESRG